MKKISLILTALVLSAAFIAGCAPKTVTNEENKGKIKVSTTINPVDQLVHIVGKGRGGKNNIENLMAKTREEHAAFGDINELIPNLLKMHYVFMETRKPIFDHTPTRDEILNWKS